jgi:hypothetical protein
MFVEDLLNPHRSSFLSQQVIYIFEAQYIEYHQKNSKAYDQVQEWLYEFFLDCD